MLVSLAMPSASSAEPVGDPLIVVTARRIDEIAADIPLDIAVISRSGIGPAAVNSLQSLAARVPGLSFESMWGGANAFPTLRGQNQPSIAGDAVGMFVDGVYQANRDAFDVEPLDLERIEVVKGPQSALFGHSSFAGLIHYVPAKPTEEYTASGSAEIGTEVVLWSDRDWSSAEVKAIAEARVPELAPKTAALEAMRATLLDLAGQYQGVSRSDCPIMSALKQPQVGHSLAVQSRLWATRQAFSRRRGMRGVDPLVFATGARSRKACAIRFDSNGLAMILAKAGQGSQSSGVPVMNITGTAPHWAWMSATARGPVPRSSLTSEVIIAGGRSRALATASSWVSAYEKEVAPASSSTS